MSKNKDRVRYSRVPSPTLRALFQENKILAPLKNLVKPSPNNVVEAFDVQFRENDRVSIYCGLTKLADIDLKGNKLKINAADSYKQQFEASRLFRNWDIESNAKDFQFILDEYLSNVQVKPRYVCKEGKVQVYYEQRLGKHFTGKDDFMICDREVVIGYKDTGEQPNLEEIVPKEIRTEIENKKWAKLSNKSLGNELDLIAINKKGDTIGLIEVKHSSANSELYYVPFQILYYLLEWRKALDPKTKEANAIIKAINDLIEAKQEIGLLPPNHLLLSVSPNRIKLQPIIAVDERKWSPEVDKRLRYSFSLVNDKMDGILGNLLIWTYNDINGYKQEYFCKD